MTDDVPDDRALRDLVAGGLTLPALLVAYEVGLFAQLERRAMTSAELAAALRLPPRSTDVLVTLATAAGLLRADAGRLALRPLARAFFLRDSPTTFAGYLDLWIASADRFSYRGIRHALLTGAPPDDGLSPEARTVALERALHDRGVVAARAWVARVDLAGHRTLLDVGGGSGVHAIEAVRRFPGLRAVVLDVAPVCALADARIAAAGLSDRLRTLAADYLDPTPFPAADVHLYAEVLHNRGPDEAARLVRKSFDALPPGGRILVHEMLLDDDGAGPPAVAAADLNMVLWTRQGRQPTRRALFALLAGAGFEALDAAATGCGYFSLVTGTKPR